LFDAFIAAMERRAQTYGQQHAKVEEEDSPGRERPAFSIRAFVNKHGPTNLHKVIGLIWDEFQELYQSVKV
jgi:hypothetical protein